MARSLLPALLALAAVLAAAPASAEPMRAIVRLVDAPGSDSDELWSRMHGQTSDLEVVIIRMADQGELSLADQIQAASRLARAYDVRAVVWLRPLPDQPGVAVYVAEPAAERVFVRHVPQREPGLAARSATAEAAALVVRSSLRALAQGTPIGVPAAALVRAEQRAQTSPDERTRWLLAVHWQAAADGAQRLGHHGVAGRAGLDLGAWHVHATVATHPAVTLIDERARLVVARHGAGLGLARRWRAGALRIDAGLDVAAILYTRATEPVTPDVVAAAPGRIPALAFAPGLRLRVPAGLPGLFLELGAAADVLLGAPEFVYQRAGASERHTRLRPVQPRASLGLAWQP
jgi:hypothetical protein